MNEHVELYNCYLSLIFYSFFHPPRCETCFFDWFYFTTNEIEIFRWLLSYCENTTDEHIWLILFKVILKILQETRGGQEKVAQEWSPSPGPSVSDFEDTSVVQQYPSPPERFLLVSHTAAPYPLFVPYSNPNLLSDHSESQKKEVGIPV